MSKKGETPLDFVLWAVPLVLVTVGVANDLLPPDIGILLIGAYYISTRIAEEFG